MPFPSKRKISDLVNTQYSACSISSIFESKEPIQWDKIKNLTLIIIFCGRDTTSMFKLKQNHMALHSSQLLDDIIIIIVTTI